MMKNLELKVSLFGKHPSSSEYLYIGNNSEFMNSVSKWIESGYESVLNVKMGAKSDKIHHFVFLNKSSDSFITGSIKLNKDFHGREFPLVIAVEVLPYASFANVEEVVKFSKTINKKVMEIFTNDYTLEELKSQLLVLSENSVVVEGKNNIFAIFMDEEFSEAKLFLRPVKVDDFITMMR